MEIKNLKQPFVSIITVNYNQSKVTADFLNSLRKISYSNYEIIVVDNASPNDTPEVLKTDFPEIQLMQSKENLGFAGGNNLAVKVAKGKYLLFINNDTEVPEHFIEPLVEALENDGTIGMVSPKIKFFWDADLVQYAGFTKMNPYTIRNNSIGYYQKDGPDFNKQSKTHAAHGAAMMLPRKVIEDVGMMTEVYFLYYEEHDWAELIKRAGYSILYEPKSYILHKESVSTGKDSPFKTYYLARNRLLFARRNYKGFEKFISVLFQLFISWPKNTVMHLFKGEFKHLSSYWRGVIWNFTHFRNIMSNPKI